MEQWTAQTKAIIDKHCKDFFVTDFDSKMKAYGGYDKYVVSLGGVFAECHGKTDKVTTVKELRKRLEYAQGLMAIWGIDYYNGKTYWRWGQGSGTKATADAFRTSGKGKCASGDIKKILNTPTIVTTNCNYGVDTLSKALGKSIWSCDYDKMLNAGNKKITQKSDLRPGDLVHFFKGSIKKANWRHVAIVYSVGSDGIWLADFGQRFVKQRKPLHAFPAEYTNYPTWLGVRYMDLEDDTVKDTNDLAVELKREVDSYLAFKRAEAGEDVYSAMTAYCSDRAAYLRAAADYVLDGYAGTGEARRVFFGEDYSDVQTKVNWVIATAQEVISGKYGTGDVRKAALGADYDVVQAQVNRILRR